MEEVLATTPAIINHPISIVLRDKQEFIKDFTEEQRSTLERNLFSIYLDFRKNERSPEEMIEIMNAACGDQSKRQTATKRYGIQWITPHEYNNAQTENIQSAKKQDTNIQPIIEKLRKELSKKRKTSFTSPKPPKRSTTQPLVNLSRKTSY